MWLNHAGHLSRYDHVALHTLDCDDDNDTNNNYYYRAMLAQSAVMRLHVVRLSVCLSVCNVQVP